MMIDSPDINTIRRSETDDLGARLGFDEVVDFAVWDEVFVRWVLGKVRKFQVM